MTNENPFEAIEVSPKRIRKAVPKTEKPRPVVKPSKPSSVVAKPDPIEEPPIDSNTKRIQELESKLVAIQEELVLLNVILQQQTEAAQKIMPVPMPSYPYEPEAFGLQAHEVLTEQEIVQFERAVSAIVNRTMPVLRQAGYRSSRDAAQEVRLLFQKVVAMAKRVIIIPTGTEEN